MTIVLDAGALIAHERRDRSLGVLLDESVLDGRTIRVPSVVVAQAWRDGSRQVLLARLLAGCIVDPVDDALGRQAGELLARTGTSDAIDAIVACLAAREEAAIITSDAADLRRLADALGGLRVVAV